MKKLLLIAMLCLTFTIPAKADFWKKLKNAVTGTDSSSSSSNSSGKTGGTRGYLSTNEYGTKVIVNPFNKNDYISEDDIYSREREAVYTYRNLQGESTKVNYVECRIRPGDFLNSVGNLSVYGYVKFPVYAVTYGYSTSSVLGCFSRDKSGKEQEITNSIYLDHDLAMYIWDNQLTVTTLAMKNGKAAMDGTLPGKQPWFDSTNPEAEIFINGKKFN